VTGARTPKPTGRQWRAAAQAALDGLLEIKGLAKAYPRQSAAAEGALRRMAAAFDSLPPSDSETKIRTALAARGRSHT